jgi:hypothetical protein
VTEAVLPPTRLIPGAGARFPPNLFAPTPADAPGQPARLPPCRLPIWGRRAGTFVVSH